MNNRDFYDLMVQTFEKCQKIARAKGEDYTRGHEDALTNFKEAAQEVGADPLLVCYIFMRKHWTAVGNYVKTKGKSQSEPIDGRLHNLINYAVLMLGLIVEERNRQEAVQEMNRLRTGTNMDN